MATPSSPIVIYQAPWVIPVSSPAIRDGAVAVKDGRIISCGSFSFLSANYPAGKIKRLPGILLPALLNSHIHLELSHLQNVRKPSADESLCDWIRELIKSRQESSKKKGASERKAVLKEQVESGVSYLLDIGNTPSQSSALISGKSPEISFLQEYLAPSRKIEKTVVASIAGLEKNIQLTAHGCYSTGAKSIKILKQRARKLKHLFSIHCAESVDELLFLGKKQGCFRSFLEERGSWDETFWNHEIDREGVVEYLDRLGVLDQQTLLVHCVHVSDRELDIIKKRGCGICLCPGSNQFLGVGLARVDRFLEQGLRPCLGTDSIASNESLDLWREMALLRENFAEINPWDVLAMTTLWAAEALGRADKLGSLESGKQARILHVWNRGVSDCDNEKGLLDFLTKNGRPSRIEMIDHRESSND